MIPAKSMANGNAPSGDRRECYDGMPDPNVTSWDMTLGMPADKLA